MSRLSFKGIKPANRGYKVPLSERCRHYVRKDVDGCWYLLDCNGKIKPTGSQFLKYREGGLRKRFNVKSFLYRLKHPKLIKYPRCLRTNCGNRNCIKPDHLEPGMPQLIFCRSGKHKTNGGKCKECRKVWERENYQKNRKRMFRHS